MKKLLVISLFFFSFSVFSQTITNSSSQLIASRTSIVMEESNFEDVKAILLANHSSKKRGYIWTLKNVMVPGIERPMTLTIQQGVSGVIKNCSSDESFICGNGSYFVTFNNEKHKQLRLDNLKSDERQTILVRAKHGKKHALRNIEEVQFLKQYLKSLI